MMRRDTQLCIKLLKFSQGQYHIARKNMGNKLLTEYTMCNCIYKCYNVVRAAHKMTRYCRKIHFGRHQPKVYEYANVNYPEYHHWMLDICCDTSPEDEKHCDLRSLQTALAFLDHSYWEYKHLTIKHVTLTADNIIFILIKP